MRITLLIICICLSWINGHSQRDCLSHDYLQQLKSSDAVVKEKILSQENFIYRQLNNPDKLLSPMGANAPQPLIIKIPVVVHVLYNQPSQNISDAQINAQIKILNEDFRRLNPDAAGTPSVFLNYAADCQFEFYLAKTDPNGFATNGIIRKKTNIGVYGLDDRIKYSIKGGDDAWDAAAYLNIWVGNLAGGLVGYSSPLGGPADKDGVVIRHNAFGKGGTAQSPFNKGRTATHEIGHWMGLQHIWGDMYCGDDGVEDTPKQQMASRGCPSGTIASCSNTGNMYMNFMDLTNDDCMNLFTVGQKSRMRAAFAPGGPRYNMLFSHALGEGAPRPVSNEPEVSNPEISISEIKIFPNPVSEKLVIQSSGNTGSELMVMNQFGQVLRRIQAFSGTYELDVKSFAPGLYIVTDSRRRNVLRFIKR